MDIPANRIHFSLIAFKMEASLQKTLRHKEGEIEKEKSFRNILLEIWND